MLNQIKNTETCTGANATNESDQWLEHMPALNMPLIKKALMDAKTSLLLILLFYPLMSVMPQEQMLFRGAENSTPDEKFLPPSKKRICP